MNEFNTPEWDKKFRSIFADMRQNKCIILVGPEILRKDGKPLRTALREQLLRTNAADIAHYYDRDGFFLFRDKIAKEDVQREVVLFYQENNLENGIDETRLLQLIRLRSHVILSITPDAFLSDVAFRHGLKHRFGYFRHGGTAVREVEPPTADMPLFYNLCGSLERDDSLVLDYDDLFHLLGSLLGSPGLPPNLALVLQQAKHFLFVGFDFDKWYSQLLLRVLSGEKAIRTFAIDPAEKNANTTTFLVKQFGIEFIEHEDAFWQSLIQRAEVENLLRELEETRAPAAVRITRFLQNGDVLAALNHLRTLESANKMATLLLAQFHDLTDRQNRQVIDSRDYSVHYNRIVDAILETIKTAC